MSDDKPITRRDFDLLMAEFERLKKRFESSGDECGRGVSKLFEIVEELKTKIDGIDPSYFAELAWFKRLQDRISSVEKSFDQRMGSYYEDLRKVEARVFTELRREMAEIEVSIAAWVQRGWKRFWSAP